MGKIEINKKLLPMKAHYFLFNAGINDVITMLQGNTKLIMYYVYVNT